MIELSPQPKLITGIALITVPTIQYGGATLLKMLRRREPGYLDNPLRQNLFRAGHAHAGVILILSFVCQILVDAIHLSDALAWDRASGRPGGGNPDASGLFSVGGVAAFPKSKPRHWACVSWGGCPGDFRADPWDRAGSIRIA